jgi:hypothetical protein
MVGLETSAFVTGLSGCSYLVVVGKKLTHSLMRLMQNLQNLQNNSKNSKNERAKNGDERAKIRDERAKIENDIFLLNYFGLNMFETCPHDIK